VEKFTHSFFAIYFSHKWYSIIKFSYTLISVALDSRFFTVSRFHSVVASFALVVWILFLLHSIKIFQLRFPSFFTSFAVQLKIIFYSIYFLSHAYNSQRATWFKKRPRKTEQCVFSRFLLCVVCRKARSAKVYKTESRATLTREREWEKVKERIEAHFHASLHLKFC
jgi:hypothetical protein